MEKNGGGKNIKSLILFLLSFSLLHIMIKIIIIIYAYERTRVVRKVTRVCDVNA